MNTTFLRVKTLRIAAVAAAAAAAAMGVGGPSAAGVSASTAQHGVGHVSTAVTGRPAPNPATVPAAQKMTAAQLSAQRDSLHQIVVGKPTDRMATMTSTNWSGLGTSGSFQGIAGEWVVPSVQVTAANHYGCTWIGIDGLTNGYLIQTGTEEDSVGGRPSYYAWLETIPASQQQIKYSNGALVPVAPGDTMWAYLMRTGTGNGWVIYLQDITRGWTLNTTVNYATPGANVEWVHEATQVGGKVGTPPVFSKVNFSNLEVEEAGKWYYTTMGGSSRIYLVQNGITYATPGVPTATSPQAFSIVYG